MVFEVNMTVQEIKKKVEEEFETRINSLSEENEEKKKQIQILK